MTGPDPVTPLNQTRDEGTSGQNNTNKIIIERHLSALKELLKELSNRDPIKPILLNLNDDNGDTDDEGKEINKRKDKGKATVTDEDLSKPFKEVLKCPFTRRIIEFSSPGHRMPTNAKIYDETGDPEESLYRNGETRRVTYACLVPDVPVNVSREGKSVCLELSKRFSDSIPKTIDETLKRVDGYVLSEEAFWDTELPKGEFQRKEAQVQWAPRNDRSQRGTYGNACRPEHRPPFRLQEHH
nr:hypothetical protein [Tanacetum cinerariifolium]